MSNWPPRPSPPRHPASLGGLAAARRAPRPLRPQVVQLLALLASVVLGYYLLTWLWVATAPKEVTIPRVIGLQYEEAVKLLRDQGLQPEVVAEKPSETVPERAVMACEPAPGRKVRAGRVIRLILSAGSKWARVPDVRDMSVDRARALIREAKLEVGKERARYHDKVPVGYVIGQTPAPGKRVLRGSEVELIVSRGTRPTVVRTEEEQPPASETRSAEITFEVPPGAQLQEVRIVVKDRKGERTVYTGYHHPGETVAREVSGEGPEVTVQVYLSGILVQERSI